MNRTLLVLAACGSAPVATPITNVRAKPVLFPAHTADCTRDGWCRFADKIPIRASAIYVDDTALYIVGYELGHAEGEELAAAAARWDGTAWKTWSIEGIALFSIDGHGSEIWASGRGVAVQHLVRGATPADDRWEAEGMELAEQSYIAVGPDDVFVTINGNILHRGAKHDWPSAYSPPSTSIYDNIVYSIAADDAGGAWAVVTGRDDPESHLVHYDPATQQFAAFDTPHPMYRVSAPTPHDVVTIGHWKTAGEPTELRRWNGTAWTSRMPVDTTSFESFHHRGRDLVVAGSIDEKQGGVTIITETTVTTQIVPGNSSEVTAGPDGSLWLCSNDSNTVWFHR